MLPDPNSVLKPDAGPPAEEVYLTREPTNLMAEVPEVEIEIQDDTPPEDKGKRVANPESDPPELTEEPTDDELKQYSAGVQKRFAKMTEQKHAERRRAEKLQRERDAQDELIRKLIADNEGKRKTLASGEGLLIKATKDKLDADLERVNRELKAAIDAGDSDAQVKANSELARIQVERDKIANYAPQWAGDDKPPEKPAPREPEERRPPAPSDRAQTWFSENRWFETDEGMRRYALGVHEELIKKGHEPDAANTKYWSELDKAVRGRFPERFEAASPKKEEPVPTKPPAASPVAPVSRAPTGSPAGASPTKVVLTQSEIAMAKRLNISPERYAQEKLRIERKAQK